ncbi:MAG: FlgD immunoglobulin-like domain containing protein [Candidatus Eiseniibacteriota bacterium]
MSRSSLTAACTFALILILIRAETTRSSYMWTPAVQISQTTHGCAPNVDPSWSKTGTRRIHHVLKECAAPNAQGCGGEGAIGWYLQVGPTLDASAWAVAWSSRHSLTGSGLRGTDFDMVVDRNDTVHVVHEVWHHPAYDMGAHPVIAYKMQGRRSWDPDTAVVLSDLLTAGTVNCLRRDHGPKLFLERTGAEDTIHVAVPYDRLPPTCPPDPPFDHGVLYLKKDLATTTSDGGSAWADETFATEGYAKHLRLGGTEMKQAGVGSIVRDEDGDVHLWAAQTIEGQIAEPDTLLWRHFWGTPGASGAAWQDTTSRVLVCDLRPPGAEMSGESSESSEQLDVALEQNGKLYFLWKLVGGPGFIHRVSVGGPYPDSTGLNSDYKRQLTASGVAVEHLKLQRATDGVWHLTWRARPDPNAEPQIWHKYVTTGQDPFDATSPTPDTPDGWSTPSMVAADFGSGIRDGKKAWYVANGDSVWISFAAEDSSGDHTDEAWARSGLRIESDSVMAGTQVWEGLVSLDGDFYVAPGCTLEIKPGTMVVVADSTDRLAGGLDPARVELIVKGVLLAEGNVSEPIEFRAADTTAVAGWYGIRFLDSSDNALSSLTYVDFKRAKYAISVDSLSGNLIHCTFANSEKADVYVDRDTRVPYTYQWVLDAPTKVLVHEDDLGADWPLGKEEDQNRVEIVVDGWLESTRPAGGAATDSVWFTSDAAGQTIADWYGIICREAGLALSYASIGHATDPVFFDGATDARVWNSTIYDFKNVGVFDLGATSWIKDSFISGAGSVTGVKNRVGIRLYMSAARVEGTTVTWEGVTGFTFQQATGIKAEWSKAYCDLPVGQDSLEILSNTVLGNGEVLGDTHKNNGLFVLWGCDHRHPRVYNNTIKYWPTRGMILQQCAETRVTCNQVIDNRTGVYYTRTSAAAGDTVRFSQNELKTSHDRNLFTDGAYKLLLRPDTQAATEGKNSLAKELQAVSSEAENVETTDTSVILDALKNTWWREGAITTSLAQIDSMVVGSGTVLFDPPLATEQLCAAPRSVAGPGQAVVSERGPVVESSSDAPLPTEFALAASAPNPVRGVTVIAYDVPPGHQGRVSLVVYDVVGRVVRTLVEGVVPPGRHQATWTGADGSGSRVASGVYFVHLRAGDYRATRTVTLLK